MAKAEHATHSRVPNGRAHKSYAKRISDHVAIGLVVYTLMLIFVTSPAMHSEGTSILPYFMLVVFVALVIPSCHNMEKRWQKLEDNHSSEASLETRFNADRIKLWVGALGIPVVLAVLLTVF
jgi:cell division protein FtsW (lipid II flippase)